MRTGSDEQALVTALLTGGVCVYPTDTVYGIGSRADSEKGVNKVYQIKQRPTNAPMPLLLADSASLAMFTNALPPRAKTLIDRFWPGSLTVVIPVKPGSVLPSLLNERGAASFRVPNNDLVRRVIQKLGVPIVGTSANIHGKPTARTFGELDPAVTNQVDYVYQGETTLGIESTVVEILGQGVHIIREGHISKFELEQVIGNVFV